MSTIVKSKLKGKNRFRELSSLVSAGISEPLRLEIFSPFDETTAWLTAGLFRGSPSLLPPGWGSVTEELAEFLCFLKPLWLFMFTSKLEISLPESKGSVGRSWSPPTRVVM